jgi:hypothetical protein
MGNYLAFNVSGRSMILFKKEHNPTETIISNNLLTYFAFDHDSVYYIKSKHNRTKIAKLSTNDQGLIYKVKNYQHETFVEVSMVTHDATFSSSFKNLLQISADMNTAIATDALPVPLLVICHQQDKIKVNNVTSD